MSEKVVKPVKKSVTKQEVREVIRTQEFVTVKGTTLEICNYLNRLRDENKRPFLITSNVIMFSTEKEETNELITAIISINNNGN